jgi:hypothetical protein
MLVQEDDQKIENLFLPLGQCHGAPLKYTSIVGEAKANSKDFHDRVVLLFGHRSAQRPPLRTPLCVSNLKFRLADHSPGAIGFRCPPTNRGIEVAITGPTRKHNV